MSRAGSSANALSASTTRQCVKGHKDICMAGNDSDEMAHVHILPGAWCAST